MHRNLASSTTATMQMHVSELSEAQAEPQCTSKDDDTWVQMNNGEGRQFPRWHLEQDALKVQIDHFDDTQSDSHSQTFLEQDGQDFAADDDGDEIKLQRLSAIPEFVVCALVLTVRKCTDRKDDHLEKQYFLKQHRRIRWQDSKNHTKLHETMDSFVRTQDPADKRAYLSTSYVRLLEWQGSQFKEVDSCVVETEKKWSRSLPRMVARFCGSDEWSPFLLEFNAEYEWFTIAEQTPDQAARTYDEAISATLRQTVFKNSEGDPYWPKKLLTRLFDKNTVSKLVNEHFDKRKTKRSTRSKLQLDTPGRHELINWLWSSRIRTMAIIIRINAKLDDLYRLMKHDKCYHDGMIPLEAEYLENFLPEKHRHIFLATQREFATVNFEKPENLEELQVQENEIVPVHFDKNDHKIGKGGTSEVYQATINPDYHAFTCDKRKPFALKRIGGMALKDARAEAEVWRYISKRPHKHINRVYTWWLQKNYFYMLSPLGERNLRSFLSSEPKPELMYQGEWILEQVEGVASGIERIHHVGRARLGLFKSRDDKADYGYHHDLKPANILIFDKTWKITDFGTAKIRRLMSSTPQSGEIYTRSLPGGDEEYGGPERIVVRDGKYRTGRSYDIWSFGCILLEVLLWCFGRTEQDFRAFREDRRCLIQGTCDCKPSQKSLSDHTESNNSSDTDGDESRVSETSKFWYRCAKAGKNHLKPCVEERLKDVEQEAAKHCVILKALCRLVRKMLQVSPGKRPEASVVLGKIGSIRVAAEVYFAKQRRDAGRVGLISTGVMGDSSQSNNEDLDRRSFRLSSQEPTDYCPSEAPGHGPQSPKDSRKRHRDSLEVPSPAIGGMLTPVSGGFNFMGGALSPNSREGHEKCAKRPRKDDLNMVVEDNTEAPSYFPQTSKPIQSSKKSRDGRRRSPGSHQYNELSDSRPLAEKRLDPSCASPQKSFSMQG